MSSIAPGLRTAFNSLRTGKPVVRRRLKIALAALALFCATFLVATMPVSTSQGINYEVSVHQVPLYLKTFDFLYRSRHYQILAHETSGSASTETERVLAIFDWTQRHVRQTPPGWTVVDDHIMTRYCDMHLARWPEHAALVERWRQSVPRYLFWALMFEVGLHFRRQEPAAGEESADRTLFEILDYRLTDQQLERVFDKLKTYRTGAFQHVAHAMVRALIHCGLTQPFTWAVGHQSSLRSLVLPRPAGTRRRMRVRPRGRDRLDGPAPGH